MAIGALLLLVELRNACVRLIFAPQMIWVVFLA
jgi:hypothetical protein